MGVVGPGSVISEDILRNQRQRDDLLVERFDMQILGPVKQQIVVVAGYALFSISCLFSATVAGSTFLGMSVFFAVPIMSVSLLVGGVSFYVAQNYINLNDTEVRNSIRKQIEQEFNDFRIQYRQNTLHHLRSDAAHFLEGIAGKYGWEAIFYYGIPEPETFKEIFNFQAQLLSITEVIALYEKVDANYRAARERYGDNLYEYEIPHPAEFAIKWRLETVRNGKLIVPITKILQPGVRDKLLRYRIITPETGAFLRRYQATYQAAYWNYCNRIKPEWEALHRATIHDKIELETAKTGIDREYIGQGVHAALREIRREQIREESRIKELQENDQELQKGRRDHEMLLRSVERTINGPPSQSRTEALRYVDLSKTRLTGIREQVNAKYRPFRHSIRKRYALQFEPVLRELQLAQNTKRGKIRLAVTRFRVNTLESRSRFAFLTKDALREYRAVLRTLGEEYLRHCA